MSATESAWSAGPAGYSLLCSSLLESAECGSFLNWGRFVSAGCVGSLAAPTKLALVIGNSAYCPPFEAPHAVRGSDAVASRLRMIGFVITSVTNVTSAGMKTAFAEFSCKLRAGCRAVVYFCGHGWQDEGSEDVQLVPVDFIWADPSGVCSLLLSLSPCSWMYVLWLPSKCGLFDARGVHRCRPRYVLLREALAA
jgi:hypothetical protein